MDFAITVDPVRKANRKRRLRDRRDNVTSLVDPPCCSQLKRKAIQMTAIVGGIAGGKITSYGQQAAQLGQSAIVITRKSSDDRKPPERLKSSQWIDTNCGPCCFQVAMRGFLEIPIMVVAASDGKVRSGLVIRWKAIDHSKQYFPRPLGPPRLLFAERLVIERHVSNLGARWDGRKSAAHGKHRLSIMAHKEVPSCSYQTVCEFVSSRLRGKPQVDPDRPKNIP